MDNAQFGTHIEELAEQIKTVAANKLTEQYEASREHEYQREFGDGMSVEEYRSFVRDVSLLWVPLEFSRAQMIPHQERSLTLANEIAAISGDAELSEEEPPGNGYLVGVDFNEILLSGGLLGDGAFVHIPTIQTNLAPWTTAAIDRFKEDFLPGITVALRNHITVAQVLRNVMAANYQMVALAREDVDGVAHDTLAALESFGDCQAPWSGDLKATLAVVAGVSAIIGGVASFPAAPPLGAAGVAGGFAILEGTIATWLAIDERRAEADDSPLGADTVSGILDNMAAALNTVYVKLDEGNEELRSVLSELGGQLEENRLACLAPRPTTFADATQDDVIEIVEG